MLRLFGYSYRLNYNIASNRLSITVANTTNPSDGLEHILLEDEDDFNPFLNILEDLLAHEET